MIDITSLSKDEKLDLANSTDSPETLRALSSEEDVLICIALASNPATPQDVLIKFLTEGKPLVQQIIAAYQELPAHVFDEIINGKNKDIRADQIAENEYLSETQFAKLARHKDDVVRIKVAANAATPGKVLDYLSKDVFPRIVQAVARNPNTPALTLRKLLYSKELVVRLLIMENPNFPTEYLATVAKDHDPVVRNKVASSVTVSLNILRKLGQDKNIQVATTAIRNPRFPLDGLNELTDSKNPLIREAIAAANNITPEILASFACDEDIKVRLAVATSSKTPVDTLFKMVTDADAEVKETVKFMLRYISDRGFETGLVNNGYPQYVGLPREWVIKAL